MLPSDDDDDDDDNDDDDEDDASHKKLSHDSNEDPEESLRLASKDDNDNEFDSLSLSSSIASASAATISRSIAWSSSLRRFSWFHSILRRKNCLTWRDSKASRFRSDAVLQKKRDILVPFLLRTGIGDDENGEKIVVCAGTDQAKNW